MNEIAVLVPDDKMAEIARNVSLEKNLGISYIKRIDTVNTVSEARVAVENGMRIIVARGYQAILVKKHTNIPLVEIRFHAQEIGLLLQKAKEIVKKECPTVGMIVFENMLGDMSYMEQLFHVHLSIVFLERIEDTAEKLKELEKDRPDIIIGGEVTCNEAQKMGYPTLFYESTRESVTEALLSAGRMAYAIEVEKQSAAQFETVLDTSFNGIIKINAEEQIIAVNKLAENLIGKNTEEIIGRPLIDVVPEIEQKTINSILKGVRENYVTSVNIRNKAWMLMIAPIQYDDRITGAILSLQKFDNTIRKERNLQNNMFLNGYSAQMTFSKIHTENKKMEETLEMAKEYAVSEAPVMIYAQTGLEIFAIAESVHNNSRRKTGPFVSVNLQNLSEEQQSELLFGGHVLKEDISSKMKSALNKANHGTLFIQGIEYLAPCLQYQLFLMIQPGTAARTDVLPMDNSDVRIIAAAHKNLAFLVKRESFDRGLYYALNSLVLEIPSINQRREDLIYYFEGYFKQYLQQYNKHLVLTQGAYDCLEKLSWNGNLIQLKSFCERLVLSSHRRSIDEVRIRKLFDELYPHVDESTEKVIIYKSQEAEALVSLLKKNHGSRRKTAEELGISTTTLWRKMKEYGIEASFES